MERCSYTRHWLDTTAVWLTHGQTNRILLWLIAVWWCGLIFLNLKQAIIHHSQQSRRTLRKSSEGKFLLLLHGHVKYSLSKLHCNWLVLSFSSGLLLLCSFVLTLICSLFPVNTVNDWLIWLLVVTASMCHADTSAPYQSSKTSAAAGRINPFKIETDTCSLYNENTSQRGNWSKNINLLNGHWCLKLVTILLKCSDKRKVILGKKVLNPYTHLLGRTKL